MDEDNKIWYQRCPGPVVYDVGRRGKNKIYRYLVGGGLELASSTSRVGSARAGQFVPQLQSQHIEVERPFDPSIVKVGGEDWIHLVALRITRPLGFRLLEWFLVDANLRRQRVHH
jgi:hypothetical protein